MITKWVTISIASDDPVRHNQTYMTHMENSLKNLLVWNCYAIRTNIWWNGQYFDPYQNWIPWHCAPTQRWPLHLNLNYIGKGNSKKINEMVVCLLFLSKCLPCSWEPLVIICSLCVLFFSLVLFVKHHTLVDSVSLWVRETLIVINSSASDH